MHVVLLEPSDYPASAAEHLRSWGYRVTSVSGLRETLGVLDDAAADEARVVLIERSALGPSAMQVVRELQRPSHSATPLLYVVPQVRAAELLTEITRIGVDDYVLRPMVRDAVGVRLRAWGRIQQLLSEDHEAVAALHFRATHDPMTGLWNKRCWFGHLFREAARCIQDDQMAVAFIDIDRFKSINDAYGHAVGDEVLRAAVQRIRRCTRPYDILGRYGGDELVSLMPGCGAQEAGTIAERIRAAIETEALLTSVGPVEITVSIGVASSKPWPRTSTAGALDAAVAVSDAPDVHIDPTVLKGPAAIVELADVAAYEAKRCGRNLVAMCTPGGVRPEVFTPSHRGHPGVVSMEGQ